MDVDTEKLIREVWSDLSAGLRRFEGRMDQRFEAVDARFDRLEARMDRVEARLTKLEGQVASLESFVTKVDQRLTKVEEDAATVRQIVVENFARVQRNFELVLAEVRDPAHKARLDKIEERLARLEQHVGLAEE